VSTKRSYPKLKLRKFYLTSTTSEERLSRLAILLTEKGILVEFKYKKVVVILHLKRQVK